VSCAAKRGEGPVTNLRRASAATATRCRVRAAHAAATKLGGGRYPVNPRVGWMGTVAKVTARGNCKRIRTPPWTCDDKGLAKHNDPRTVQAPNRDTLAAVLVYSLYPVGVPGIMATSSCCPIISYGYV